MREERMSIGVFSKLSGVSPRTLRFYEQKGLLQPSYVSESGRRYYRESDLVTVQRIIALKYLGYSLEEIHSLSNKENDSLQDSLRFQRESMRKKRAHIDRMIKAIDHTLVVLDSQQTVDPALLVFLIHNILHEEEHLDWMKQYVPAKYVEHALSQYPMKEMEWNQRAAAVFQGLKDLFKTHAPQDDEVQQHVRALFDLLKDMLGEHLDLEGWGEIPDEEILPRQVYPFTQAEEEKLAQAIEHYYIVEGGSLYGNRHEEE